MIQTYNQTTYNLCSLNQDYGNLTSQWTSDSEGDDGGGSGEDAVTVLLSMVGGNYFFSNINGGTDCRKGMKFQIVVVKREEKPFPAAPPATSNVNSTRQRETQLSGGRRGREVLNFCSFAGIILLVFSG